MLLFLIPNLANAQFWKKDKKNEDAANEAGFIKPDKFHLYFFEGMREYGLENYDKAIKNFDECLKLDAGSVAAYFQLSKVYEAQGVRSLAITNAQKAFELDKTNPDTYHNYKEMCLNTRNFSLAISATQQFIGTLDSDSKKIKYKKVLATLYEYNREQNKAIEVYHGLENDYGFSNSYAQERLRLYKTLNQYDEAINEAELLIANNTGVAAYSYQKATLLAEKGDYDEALKYYEQALYEKPDHSKAMVESASLLIRNKQTEKGIERLRAAFESSNLDINEKINAYNKISTLNINADTKIELAKILQSKHTESSSANKALADALFERGDKKEGVIYLAKAKEIEPNNFNYSVELVNTYYELGDYENLKKYSVQAAELYPTHNIFYLYAGIAFTELDDYNNALMMLETGRSYVIGQNSIKYDFKLSLAELFYKMGEFTECEKVYDEILAEQPTHATALNNYAYFLARRGYRLKDAEKFVAKAMSIEGENASFIDTYGYVLMADKKYDKAVENFTKALEFDANSAEILEHKGDALYQLGQKDDALEYWKKAKENGGSSQILIKKIENKKYYAE